MWKIIKTWLPPKSVEKIKFVDKKNLSEYVTNDQMLTGWGGKDDYDGTFEPEVQAANGEVDSKKVSYAMLYLV